ncbi:hypothetical protein COBT_004152, partial [Conglomerata obtusa]
NIQEYVGKDEEIRVEKENIELYRRALNEAKIIGFNLQMEELGDLEKFKTEIKWGSIDLNGVGMEE